MRSTWSSERGEHITNSEVLIDNTVFTQGDTPEPFSVSLVSVQERRYHTIKSGETSGSLTRAATSSLLWAAPTASSMRIHPQLCYQRVACS
jgi:hypothetical protein